MTAKSSRNHSVQMASLPVQFYVPMPQNQTHQGGLGIRSWRHIPGHSTGRTPSQMDSGPARKERERERDVKPEDTKTKIKFGLESETWLEIIQSGSWEPMLPATSTQNSEHPPPTPDKQVLRNKSKKSMGGGDILHFFPTFPLQCLCFSPSPPVFSLWSRENWGTVTSPMPPRDHCG